MDEKMLKRWLKKAEPLPLTPGEFASQAGVARAIVEEWVSSGQINSVTTQGAPRIPLSVYEQFARTSLEQTLVRQREIRLGLALSLETGLIVERGLNKEGAVIYRRTAQH